MMMGVGVGVAVTGLLLRGVVANVKAALDSAGCEFGEMELDTDVRYPVVWEGTAR